AIRTMGVDGKWDGTYVRPYIGGRTSHSTPSPWGLTLLSTLSLARAARAIARQLPGPAFSPRRPTTGARSGNSRPDLGPIGPGCPAGSGRGRPGPGKGLPGWARWPCRWRHLLPGPMGRLVRMVGRQTNHPGHRAIVIARKVPGGDGVPP